MNLRKPLLVGKMNTNAPQAQLSRSAETFRFMIKYLGDHNPALDRWADELAETCQGQRLGESYCRLSGERHIQYGFTSRESAQSAKNRFDRADLSGWGDHYELTASQVTNQGWVYPPPVQPISPPH